MVRRDGARPGRPDGRGLLHVRRGGRPLLARSGGPAGRSGTRPTRRSSTTRAPATRQFRGEMLVQLHRSRYRFFAKHYPAWFGRPPGRSSGSACCATWSARPRGARAGRDRRRRVAAAAGGLRAAAGAVSGRRRSRPCVLTGERRAPPGGLPALPDLGRRGHGARRRQPRPHRRDRRGGRRAGRASGRSTTSPTSARPRSTARAATGCCSSTTTSASRLAWPPRSGPRPRPGRPRRLLDAAPELHLGALDSRRRLVARRAAAAAAARPGAATTSAGRPRGRAVDGRVGTLGCAIVHYNYETVGQFLRKQRRYAALDARHAGSRRGERGRARRLLSMPARELWRRYVRLEGRRDGLHGAALATLTALAAADAQRQVLRRGPARSPGRRRGRAGSCRRP